MRRDKACSNTTKENHSFIRKYRTQFNKAKITMVEPSTNIGTVKEWFTFIVAVVACVAGIIFWVQTTNDPKFSKIESDIQMLRSDVKNIRDNNNEILRVVGRLEGKLDK